MKIKTLITKKLKRDLMKKKKSSLGITALYRSLEKYSNDVCDLDVELLYPKT